MEKDLLYLIALKLCPNLGDRSIRKMIFIYQTAKNVWEASHSDLLAIPQIGKNTIKYIGNFEILAKAEKEIEYCIKNNIQLVSIWEDHYPSLLKECNDAPILIFYKGNFNWEIPCLSIVGTRNMTLYGKQFTEDLVECLRESGVNIVSGLALGIDAVAHKKAVDLNISTLGVLGHGLKSFYPSQNKELALSMLNKGGIISEFISDHLPERANFIQRNRIIAGLSSVTVIIESAYGGGAISTAKFANSYNREVLALPGKVTDVYSQGCNQLIKNLEAQIITKPEDILAYFSFKQLKINNDDCKSIIKESLFEGLSIIEKDLINYLQINGRSELQEICLSNNYNPNDIIPILSFLELKNIIKSNSGRFFEVK